MDRIKIIRAWITADRHLSWICWWYKAYCWYSYDQHATPERFRWVRRFRQCLRCPQKWCCPCQRLTSIGKVCESLADQQQSLSKLAERRRMSIEPLQIWWIKWQRRRLWVFVSLDHRMLCENIYFSGNVQKEEYMLLMQHDPGPPVVILTFD